MAALEAAAQVKMQAAVEERSLKQSGRFRLVADPSIPVTAIQGALTGFLQFKQKKDLWSLICPPPTGPMSYGWHTAPHGEWLSKVAGLLFDLVKVCPNTKLTPTKLSATLRAMNTNRDLEFSSTPKGHTTEDMIDKCGLTLRILLSMLRNLKLSPGLRTKVFRMLSKQDQVKIDLVLERVVLPAEMMGMEYVDDDEKSSAAIVSMESSPAPSPESLAIVPYQPPKPKTEKKSQPYYLSPFPAIFQRILGQKPKPEAPASSGTSAPMAPAHQKPKSQGTSAPMAPAHQKPKSQGSKSKPVESSLLSKAMSYQPTMVVKEKKKANEKKSVKNSGQKRQSDAEPKSIKPSQKPKEKKGTHIQQESQYEAGKMAEIRSFFIKQYMESMSNMGKKVTRSDASKAWMTSTKRAQLLAQMPLPELKRRRFVPKDCEENPFPAMIEASSVE